MSDGILPPDPPAEVWGVGVTGHRKLGSDPRTPLVVHARCVRILERLEELARQSRAGLRAYSALAIGADMLFAQAAVGLGIPLVGIIPFADYPNDFQGSDRAQFELLLGLCAEVRRLPGKKRSHQGYFRAGKVMVDRIDYLVAVWDGRPAAGVGGTGDVVAYAQSKKRPILHIDVTRS
jgi:hypothetical protein